ncbi:MAG: hypothetical protein ACWA6X_01030 [Bauldia sp.]
MSEISLSPDARSLRLRRRNAVVLTVLLALVSGATFFGMWHAIREAGAERTVETSP